MRSKQEVAPYKPICPHCRARLVQVVRDGKPATQEFDGTLYSLMMCSSCRSSFSVIYSDELEAESQSDTRIAPPHRRQPSPIS